MTQNTKTDESLWATQFISQKTYEKSGEYEKYVIWMPNYYQSTEAVKQLYITMFTSAFHNYISECMLESLIVRLSKVKALLENQTMQHYRGGKKNSSLLFKWKYRKQHVV